MRITRLRIQGVRRHRDLDIQPHAGLTVIRGPNEAGKSTIQQAIEMCLFRKSTSTAREMADLQTWGADLEPRVDMSFENDGRPGHLTKVFAGQRGTVELELDGELYQDPSQVDTLVAEMTGLASEKFLRSTASVRHHELEGLDRNEGTLRDRLQQSISGADSGTHVARRRLEEVVRRYRAEGVRNPGHLKRTRDELERLQDDLTQGEAALTRLEADRTALALAHDLRAELDARVAYDQDAVDAGERAVRLETSATEAEARYMRLRQAVQLQARIAKTEREHPSAMPLPQLREDMRRLKDLLSRVQELESGLEIEPYTADVSVTLHGATRWQPLALLATVCLVGAFVIVGASALTSITGPVIGLAVAALLLMGTVVSGLWSFRLWRRGRDVARQAELRAVDLERRPRDRTQDEDELRSAQRERDALLIAMGVADVYAGDVLLDREAAHVAAIDEIRAEMRGVLAGVAVNGDLVAERDRAAAKMDQSRHALLGLGGAAADPAAARTRAQETLRLSRLEREGAIQAEGQAQGRVDQNMIDAESVAALAEAVATTEERLAAQERRVRVLTLALETLDNAEQVTMKNAARYLEQHMGDDIAAITDDRYRRVQVDEHDLAFRVYSAELGDWVPIQQLSRGTLDQVYLAARLGLVRQVTQQRRPPLVMDDPFVTFDDERATRAAHLLKRLAADHQVLYLTCSDRFDAIADAVIELPRPTARDRTVDPVTLARDGSPSASMASSEPTTQASAADVAVPSSTRGAEVVALSIWGADADMQDAWPAVTLDGPAPWDPSPIGVAGSRHATTSTRPAPGPGSTPTATRPAPGSGSTPTATDAGHPIDEGRG